MRTHLRHMLIPGGSVVVLLLAMALPLRAQMVTGSNMEDFSKTFRITAQGWSVQQTGCSLGANALWPREQAEFTFFVKPERAFQGSLKVDVIQYGTKGKPGDWWKPVVFKIADTSSTQLEVDFPEQGGFVKVTPRSGTRSAGTGSFWNWVNAVGPLARAVCACPSPNRGGSGCRPTPWTWAGRMRCRRLCSMSSSGSA